MSSVLSIVLTTLRKKISDIVLSIFNWDESTEYKNWVTKALRQQELTPRILHKESLSMLS